MYVYKCVDKGIVGCTLYYKKGLSKENGKVAVSSLSTLYLKYKIYLIFYIYFIDIFKIFHEKM